MLRFLIFVLCSTIAYGARLPNVSKAQVAMHWNRDGRIIGGTDAEITDAPYQVALLFESSPGVFTQMCGGSLIGSTMIISAAHCSYTTVSRDWKIRVGSAIAHIGGEVSDVIRIYYPREFDENTIDNDISLWVLPLPVRVDGFTVGLIRLPIQNVPVDEHDQGLVTGWGATQEGGSTANNLQKVLLLVVDHKKCVEAYDGINPVTERMFCAGDFADGGKDACHGDSGGPFNYNGILVGITSWGLGCGRPGYPGVWTRVSHFRNWIDNQLRIEGLL